MITRLVVHLGHAKTGSTALQWGLWVNRERLDELGVHVLRTGAASGSAHHVELLPGFDIAAAQRELDALDPAVDWTVVVTSEAFAELGPDDRPTVGGYFAALARGAPVQGHIYLRNPLDWMQSLALHRITSGAMTTSSVLALNRPLPDIAPEEFAHLVRLCWSARFHQRVAEMVDGLGLNEIRLHAYDRSAFPDGSVFRHFLAATEIPADGMVDGSSMVNPSMPLEAVVAIDRELRGDDGVHTAERHRAIVAHRDLADVLGGQPSFLRSSSLFAAAAMVSEDLDRLIDDHPGLAGLRTSSRPPATDPDLDLVERYRDLLDEHLALPHLAVGGSVTVDPGILDASDDGIFEFTIKRWDRMVHADRFDAVISTDAGRSVRLPVHRRDSAATPRFGVDLDRIGPGAMCLVGAGPASTPSGPIG